MTRETVYESSARATAELVDEDVTAIGIRAEQSGKTGNETAFPLVVETDVWSK